MLTLTVHIDPDTDEGDFECTDVSDDAGERSVILHPPGVPRTDGAEFHLMLMPGGQVAVYEGRMVAWRSVDQLTGAPNDVEWTSLL